jgi:hypothetical protein
VRALLAATVAASLSACGDNNAPPPLDGGGPADGGTPLPCAIANPSKDPSSRFGAEVRMLANGNIVVSDPTLNVSGNERAGAVYLFNGTTCALISTLTGTGPDESVGGGGIGVLTTGNFVVLSNYGAVGPTSGFSATFVNGTTGLNGFVSAANSLLPGTSNLGSTAVPCLTGQPALPASTCGAILENILNANPKTSPLIASGSPFSLGLPPLTNELFTFIALPTGNYLVASPGSNAVTFGSGTTGVTGTISAENSIIGNASGGPLTFASGVLSPCSLGNSITARGNFTVGAPACGGQSLSASGAVGAKGQIPTPNTGFANLTELSDGNFVVNNAGTIELRDGKTTALLSSLTGADAASTVTPLTNGNFVVVTTRFNGGAGAVTWVSGSKRGDAAISAANSLVGTAAADAVGSGGVTVLSSGNYVVSSPSFGGGLGAATFGSGNTGTTGTVSSGNSFVGAAAADHVSSGSVTALANGNYVVRSPEWNSGRGAASFGSGVTGSTGAVSAANSLVGASPGDWIAANGVAALANGNYVVLSSAFGSGAGAATFGNGATGTTGVLSSANSLVGGSADDRVGTLTTLLPNGGYLIHVPAFSGGRGAIAFGSGTAGVTGVVGASNSLVGSAAGGLPARAAITVLSNGNYLVVNPSWSSGLGAVTFGSGTTGVTGIVSAANSLVGNNANDRIGSGVFNDEVAGLALPRATVTPPFTRTRLNGVIGLSSGNYVVMSPDFNGGVGAATFGGPGGVFGFVTAANSLLGTTAGDHVSGGGVRALPSGNYLVMSPLWSNGGTTVAAGAVTFGNGITGVSGTVSAANSLVGAAAGDLVGFTGLNFLNGLPSSATTTSAALFQTLFAQGGGTGNGIADLAQFGIGPGTSVLFGQVRVLGNGNYVVMSPYFNGERGAATLGSSTSGVVGAVSAQNSLVGRVPHGFFGAFVQESPANGIFIASGMVDMAHAAVDVLMGRWTR